MSTSSFKYQINIPAQ
ncbi:hypothetical protein A2U01_0096700, partial [Trifolium medium]|nr:hypothetical protein [Trifolium medium]